KLGKQWIYKCLAHLEEEGFIQVDRISSPKKYQTDTNRIKQVLERKITETRTRLAVERKHMGDNIETLEKQDMKIVTDYMLTLVRGSELLVSSEILEGNQAIKNAIIEMISDASENDVISISEKIKMQDIKKSKAKPGPVESAWMQATQKGAKVRILVEFSGSSKIDVKKDVAAAMGDSLAMVGDLIKSGRLMFRTTTSTPFPYKLVTLNREAMVITLVGKEANPDDGIVLLEQSNPALFNYILDKFNKIWDEGIDVMELLFKISK
ncbi:MAG: hypothetical protein ACTSV2_09905, partial [Candidatus Thorarchaeota archaeon]